MCDNQANQGLVTHRVGGRGSVGLWCLPHRGHQRGGGALNWTSHCVPFGRTQLLLTGKKKNVCISVFSIRFFKSFLNETKFGENLTASTLVNLEFTFNLRIITQIFKHVNLHKHPKRCPKVSKVKYHIFCNLWHKNNTSPFPPAVQKLIQNILIRHLDKVAVTSSGSHTVQPSITMFHSFHLINN